MLSRSSDEPNYMSYNTPKSYIAPKSKNTPKTQYGYY